MLTDREFLLAYLRQGPLLRWRAARACLETAERYADNDDVRMAMGVAIYLQLGLLTEDVLTWLYAVPRWVRRRPEKSLADAFKKTDFHPRKGTESLTREEILLEVKGLSPGKFLKHFGLPHDPNRLVQMGKLPPEEGPRIAEKLKRFQRQFVRLLPLHADLIKSLNKIKHGPQIAIDSVEGTEYVRLLFRGAEVSTGDPDEQQLRADPPSALVCNSLDDLRAIVDQMQWIGQTVLFMTYWIYVATIQDPLTPDIVNPEFFGHEPAKRMV